MEAHAPDSPQLELHDAEKPGASPELKHVLPLRIVKRSGSTSGDDADDRPCRRCSQATTESRGSAPGSIEDERQLTLPKVRGSRNSQVFSDLGDVDESPVPLGREAYLRKGWLVPSVLSRSTLTDSQSTGRLTISSSAKDRGCHQTNTIMSTQRTCNQLAPVLHADYQISEGKASQDLPLGSAINSAFSALAIMFHHRTALFLASWATSCRDRELRRPCLVVTQMTRSLLSLQLASQPLSVLSCLM